MANLPLLRSTDSTRRMLSFNLDVENPTMRVPNSYASSFLKGLVMKWVAI